ncbi:Tetratricopeptide repeat protein 16 [Chytriomyces hyalinus]|nr:Tetratricopeptide repeat protein 16 [Chytriomyces hyalinus]
MPKETAQQIIAAKATELNNKAVESLFSRPDGGSSSDVVNAISHLSRAIFLVPVEPSYYIYRAEAYLLVSDFESAIANFKKAQELLPPRRADPKKPQVHLKLQAPARKMTTGASLTEDEADLFFSESRFQAISSSSAWFNMRLRRVYFTFGQILLDQRRLHESLRYLKLSRDLGMNPSSVYLRMVAVYIGLNDTDQALELLYNLIHNHPTQVDLYILRAKLYSELGHCDLVSMDLRKVVQIRPDHPEVRQLMEYVIWTAIKYKNMASQEILKGQLDVAIFFLNHALELDPYDWITLLKRGVIFSEMGHHDSALGDLTGVLERDDRDKARDGEVKSYISSVYNKQGIDYFITGRPLEAIQTFNKALEYSDKEAIIYKNLADCHWKLNDDKSREKALLRAYQLDYSDTESREKLADLYFRRGERAIFAGEYPYGLIELSKAIDLNKIPRFLFERARVYVLMENHDLARVDLLALLALEPGHREAHAMMDQLTVGIPLDNLKPFPPQKRVVKGPFDTTGNARKVKDCKLPLEVPHSKYGKPNTCIK